MSIDTRLFVRVYESVYTTQLLSWLNELFDNLIRLGRAYYLEAIVESNRGGVLFLAKLELKTAYSRRNRKQLQEAVKRCVS